MKRHATIWLPFAIILIATIVVALHHTSNDKIQLISTSGSSASHEPRFYGKIDYDSQSPRDVIEFLRNKEGSVAAKWRAPDGWLNVVAIEELRPLINDHTPCAAIYSHSYSGGKRWVRSTISHEVDFMIRSMSEVGYFPGFVSAEDMREQQHTRLIRKLNEGSRNH
jgi:hypothetical protein